MFKGTQIIFSTLYLWFPKRCQGVSDKSKESILIRLLYSFQDEGAVPIK